MSDNIKRKIFGSDIPKWLKQKLSIRQQLNNTSNIYDAIDSTENIFGSGAAVFNTGKILLLFISLAIIIILVIKNIIN